MLPKMSRAERFSAKLFSHHVKSELRFLLPFEEKQEIFLDAGCLGTRQEQNSRKQSTSWVHASYKILHVHTNGAHNLRLRNSSVIQKGAENRMFQNEKDQPWHENVQCFLSCLLPNTNPQNWWANFMVAAHISGQEQWVRRKEKYLSFDLKLILLEKLQGRPKNNLS